MSTGKISDNRRIIMNSVRFRGVKVGDPNRNLHIHDFFFVNICYIETNNN